VVCGLASRGLRCQITRGGLCQSTVGRAACAAWPRTAFHAAPGRRFPTETCRKAGA
jgi:hypothetical protein